MSRALSPTPLPGVHGSGSGRLEVDGVSLVYDGNRGSLKALDSVSMNIQSGEFVSVLGPSGCGKSTLLRLASGLLPASAGRLALNGQVIAGPRRDVGIVFQQPTLLPWKTAIENVLVPIRAMSGRIADFTDRARSLLRLAGLEEFENSYPWELSGGMQQRVGIARGLIHQPSLLLMDEPFSALDAMSREHMMSELQKIWMSTRNSVLFITHSIPEAVFLSDRIYVLSGRPGRVANEFKVNLPRPRDESVMASVEFGELTNRLRACFRTSGPASVHA